MDTAVWVARLQERHWQAVERLVRDMANEDGDADPVRFLAYDTANFVYAFLLTISDKVTPTDRNLRNDVQDAILAVLASHCIEASSLTLGPSTNCA